MGVVVVGGDARRGDRIRGFAQVPEPHARVLLDESGREAAGQVMLDVDSQGAAAADG